jgi:hypothetical protein
MSMRRWVQVLALTVVTVSLLIFSGMASAQGNRDHAFEHVKQVQERNTARLMARQGIVGTAIGVDYKGEHAILVLLEKAGVAGIPADLEGVPVQAVVTGKFYALPKPSQPQKPVKSPTVKPTDWFPRPVPIGVSTGHPAITAGTIGCRVKDAAGKTYALSNNHVYANCNRGRKNADHVLQPGPYDGGTDTDYYRIGVLSDYKDIVFSTSASNTIDAAIADISDGGTPEVDKATPSNGYGTPSTTVKAASVGLPVQKYGRTTSLTKGKVYALNATTNVNYGDLNRDGKDEVARFVGQIIITPGTFSAGGDSGSLIVTQEGNNPVGLLFAGSNLYTIANPIDVVLSYFKMTIDGQ